MSGQLAAHFLVLSISFIIIKVLDTVMVLVFIKVLVIVKVLDTIMVLIIVKVLVIIKKCRTLSWSQSVITRNWTLS